MSNFDIAVIGAGIIGLTAALRLQTEGMRVCLIDANPPDSGCSSGNAGYLSIGNCFPTAAPGLPAQLPRLLFDRDGPLVIRLNHLFGLIPWGLRLIKASTPQQFDIGTHALAQLTSRAVRSYHPLLKRANASDLLLERGGLHVYRSAEALRKRAAAKQTYDQHGISMQTLSAAEAHEMEPAISREIAGAVYFPQSAHCVSPLDLGRRLAAHIAANGGQMVRDKVVALRPAAQGWTVETTRRLMLAPRVLVAAGRWSDELLTPLGYCVPLEAERGYHLSLLDPGVTLHRTVVAAEDHFAMTPMVDGLRLAGTVEFARRNAPMDPGRADMLFPPAEKLVPGLKRSPASRWMGHRPSLPDSLPAIGRCERHENLFYSFGHHHYGLTLAAVSADLLADVVTERPPSISLIPFSLQRFSNT